MKPCSHNRKPIAWLALGTLADQQALALREHLAGCEGCRRYLAEISNVTKNLSSAEVNSNMEASARFHQRVADKLQTTKSASVLENLAVWFRGATLTWRVALPAAAALVIVFTALAVLRQQPAQPAPLMVQATAPSSPGISAPTIANYQMAARQSSEKLDELLMSEGNTRLPPAPVYTVASLNLATESF